MKYSNFVLSRQFLYGRDLLGLPVNAQGTNQARL